VSKASLHYPNNHTFWHVRETSQTGHKRSFTHRNRGTRGGDLSATVIFQAASLLSPPNPGRAFGGDDARGVGYPSIAPASCR